MSELDELINLFCRTPTRTGELAQLATLFDQRLVTDLFAACSLLARSPSDAMTIELGWIDKIPVAKDMRTKRGTELGDAFLVCRRYRVSPRVGSVRPLSATGLLIQAKVTDLPSRLGAPQVPVAVNRGSTSRELKLYTSWPRFRLHKTGRSKDPVICRDLDLNPARATSPSLGWFAAAPRMEELPDRFADKWPSWWMCAPAIEGEPLATSLGLLLARFFSGRPTSSTPGRVFHRNRNYRCDDALDDWSAVCNALLELIRSTRAPLAYFEPGTFRSRRGGGLFAPFFWHAPASRFETFLHGDGELSIARPPGTPRLGQRRRGSGMPVLILRRFTFDEGEAEAERG